MLGLLLVVIRYKDVHEGDSHCPRPSTYGLGKQNRSSCPESL